MTVEQFFQKYANMPLSKRGQIICVTDFGLLTWDGLYDLLQIEEEKIRYIALNGAHKILLTLGHKHWKLLQEI